MRITSRDNPGIKLYIQLSGSRKHRRERGLFVMEGLRLCLDAARENVSFHTVFVTDAALEKYGEALEPLRQAAGVNYHTIADELGERLSDTGTPQGIFAVCVALDKNDLKGTICNNGKYLILHNLQDPGNVGTILRTADAVGITGVFLSGCCDLYNPKTIRATMGSLFRLKTEESLVLEEIVERMTAGNIPVYAAVVESDVLSLADCDFTAGAAVVIGNEGNGLAPEAVALCGRKLTIRMKGNANSLNAAMAAGIIMWEMLR